MSERRSLSALAVALTAYVWFGSACSADRGVNTSSATAVSTGTQPCDPYTARAIQLVITRFLSAYNAGASDITERYIAPPGQFQWYGAPGRQYPDDPVSADRSTLPAYFAVQHSKGDSLDLKEFSYTGTNSAINGAAVNFAFTLNHRVAGGRVNDAPGKGALACASGKIAVWRISSW